MNDFAPSTRRADSKRRIGLIKKVSRAPGQALSDFNIFKLVAHYWAARKWSLSVSVFQILKELIA
jgi:assimilatory nitrate reductase catalytic subunit